MHKRKVATNVSNSITVSNLEHKQNIIACFPQIELPKETLLHQKVVNADMYIASPYGTKYFAWITTTNYVKLNDTNKPICLFVESGNNTYLPSQSIFYINLERVETNWINHYIFHGILFKTNSNSALSSSLSLSSRNNPMYFAVDYMYDFKSSHILGNKSFDQTLQLFQYIFTQESFMQLRKDFISTNMLHIGTPIMEHKFSDLLNKLSELPYNIQYIQFRYFNHKENDPIKFVKYFKPNLNKTMTQTRSSIQIQNSVQTPTTLLPSKPNNNVNRLSHAVFKVYAKRQQDMYKLVVEKNGQECEVDTAYIPNYKVSILMNGLFRNQKINTVNNIDYQEESEDEDEDELTSIDEKKSENIMCEYSRKFKKWVPLHRVSPTHEIIDAISMGL